MPIVPLGYTCSPWETPPDPPNVTIPHLGLLEQSRKSIRSIPDPTDYISSFPDVLGPSIAPVKRWLELVEAMLAIYNCMNAIPKAIISLNPIAVFNCLEDLVKAFGVILDWIPPFPYVRMAMKILRYCVDVVDAITELFEDLDSRLTVLTTGWDAAVAAGDIDLQAHLNCGFSEVEALVENLQPLINVMSQLNDPLMSSFARLIGGKTLEDAVAKYQEAMEWNTLAYEYLGVGLPLPELPGYSVSAVSQHSKIPIPPMGAFLENLNRSRDAFVVLYNLIAPWVGLSPDLTHRSVPEFVNF